MNWDRHRNRSIKDIGTKATLRTFDTIKHIAGRASGLLDCIVGLWRPFLEEVAYILE
jgi:hypothetical protein